MRVEHMEGALLDLWVALAMGMRRSPDHPDADPNSGHYWLRMGRYSSVYACPRFTFAPRDTLNVIDRESIALMPVVENGVRRWRAAHPNAAQGVDGETLAIAACRAVVLAHFGEDPQLDTSDEPTDYDENKNGPRAYSTVL